MGEDCGEIIGGTMGGSTGIHGEYMGGSVGGHIERGNKRNVYIYFIFSYP